MTIFCHFPGQLTLKPLFLWKNAENTLLSTCQNTGFLWPVFSCARRESSILSFYENIWVKGTAKNTVNWPNFLGYLSTEFPHQEIRWNYVIFYSEKIHTLAYFTKWLINFGGKKVYSYLKIYQIKCIRKEMRWILIFCWIFYSVSCFSLMVKNTDIMNLRLKIVPLKCDCFFD